MHWLQLAVETADTEPVEDLMLALGAGAVSLTNASERQLFEPAPGSTPLWERCWVVGLFPSATDPLPILAAVQNRLELPQLPPHRIELLEDRDWVRAWMEHFKPMRFGRRLWICPSGFTLDAADGVVVHLDPGLAFGTGTHPTTALCLEWLDQAEVAGHDVVDYGCGSGILAIAAALLGARRVDAVDIDPQALTATADNAARNAAGDRIRCGRPETLAPGSADLLLANILAGPLLELAPRLAELLRPRGELVLAGLLDSQAPELCAAYAPWFDMTPGPVREGWQRLQGRRRSD